MRKFRYTITCLFLVAALCVGCSNDAQELRKVDRKILFDLVGQSKALVLESLDVREEEITDQFPNDSRVEIFKTPIAMEYAGVQFETQMDFSLLDTLGGVHYTKEYAGMSVECARDIARIAKTLQEEYGAPHQETQNNFGGVLKIEDQDVDRVYKEIINGRYAGFYLWCVTDQLGADAQEYLASIGDGSYQYLLYYEWEWNDEANTTTVRLRYTIRPGSSQSAG